MSRVVLLASIALGTSPVWAQPVELAPQISISSSRGRLPNIDPLVDPDTFFLVGANQTRDLPLDIVSFGYLGPIFLSASCCASGGIGNGLSFSVVPSEISTGTALVPSQPIVLPSGTPGGGGGGLQTTRVAVRVSTPSNVVTATAGTFLATVDASSQRGFSDTALKARAHFVVSMVAIPADDTSMGCPGLYQRTPENLPLSALTSTLFAAKAAQPAKTAFVIGVLTRDKKTAGWEIWIDKARGVAPPLNPDEAFVEFVNGTTTNKSLYTVQGVQGCEKRPRQSLALNPGAKGSLRISRASADTLVFGQAGGEIAIFNQANFWVLFGGRRVTITWLYR